MYWVLTARFHRHSRQAGSADSGAIGKVDEDSSNKSGTLTRPYGRGHASTGSVPLEMDVGVGNVPRGPGQQIGQSHRELRGP